MNTHQRRGFLASAGALLTAAALVFGGASAAQAADMPDSSDIVITKLSTPPTGPGAAATGIAVGQPGGPSIPTGANPIGNVTFTAYPITVAGTPGSNIWQQNVAAVTLAQAQAQVDGGAAGTAHVFPGTDSETGQTSWPAAPRGLYLIRETSAPAGVTPSGDFLVAVPLTDPANRNAWLSAVYVYPKNSSVQALKTIAEGSSVAVGQNVTWSVLADIPRDETISKFELADTLDARLTPLNTAPNTPTVALTGTPGVTLTSGTDYKVTFSGQTVTLAFEASGREKLVTAWKTDPTSKVKLDLPTQVNTTALGAVNTAAASINNTAVLTVNDAAPANSTTATLKVGGIKIDKVRAGATGTKVAGAVFSVYANETDAKNRQNPIVINGASTWASDVNGAVTIDGLFFSNFVNGVGVANSANYRSYWINEVTAPTGYQLLAQPLKVDVTAAGSDIAVTQVQNVANANGFVLPLTGGMGTAFLTIGGIALLAFVLLLVARRRRQEAAAE